MTTIKTPEQIAREHFNTWAEGDTYRNLVGTIAAAIEDDRRQRDLYELIAEALDERSAYWPDDCDAARDAADAIRSDEEGDIWDRFIGPMLDAMEEEYGR